MTTTDDELMTKLRGWAASPKFTSIAEQADTLLADLIAEAVACKQHAREGDGAGFMAHGLKMQAMIDATDRDGLAALAARAVAALARLLIEQAEAEEAAV